MRSPTGLGRRDFMKGIAAALGLGALGVAPELRSEGSPPRIRRHPTLGRTGLEISDISFGSSRSDDPDLPRYALDRGD